jgi:hypothetical protein
MDMIIGTINTINQLNTSSDAIKKISHDVKMPLKIEKKDNIIICLNFSIINTLLLKYILNYISF